MIKFIYITAILIAINGCSTHLQAIAPDKVTHRFETSEKIDRVIVNEKVDFNKYNKLLVIYSSSNDHFLNNFLVDSFKNMGLFNKVIPMEELISSFGYNEPGNEFKIESFVKQLDDRFADYDFLLLGYDVRKPPGFFYEGNLKVYNAKSSELLLHIYHRTFAWNGLDKPMHYPLFNGFIDWAEQGKQ